MIKNLIFDFGMVLVRYDYRKFFQTIFDDDSEIDAFEKVFCSFDFVQRNCLGDDAFIDIIREYQDRYPKWKNQIQQYHDRALDAMTDGMPFCSPMRRNTKGTLHNTELKYRQIPKHFGSSSGAS